MSEPVRFFGMSDASAAAFLGAERFVCCDDESNTLRIYDIKNPQKPESLYELDEFLRIDPEHPEADIEGAARIGNCIYWISSHGRSSAGKPRPARCAFFATEIVTDGNKISLKPKGRPYRDLLNFIISQPDLARLGLGEASGSSHKKIKKLAPKEDGINIEALSASANGRSLYIGFRNPTFKTEISGKTVRAAIVLELLNADEIITGKAPRFGEPLLWDLHSLGLRSMEYSPADRSYYIVAGPKDGGGDCKLFRWTGDSETQPEFVQKILPELKDFSTEALLVDGVTGELTAISDDGSLRVRIDSPDQCMAGELLGPNMCRNKHLVDMSRRSFRAVRLEINQR